MVMLVSLAMTVAALWIAEVVGSVHLRGWAGALLTAIVCRMGETGVVLLLNLAGVAPTWMPTAAHGAGVRLALELGWTAALLFLAGNVIPGVRINGFLGLVTVTGLVVGASYATTALLMVAFGAIL